MDDRLLNVSRGDVATRDMKLRITALRADGADILEVLWERHRQAEAGAGYVYDYYLQERATQAI